MINFLKPTFYDFDSYYFLNISCDRTVPSEKIGETVWSFFPCNELILKGLECILFGFCLIILYLIGKETSTEKASWLPMISCFFLFFPSLFFKLENDLLAIPFIFVSLYFLVKWVSSKKNREFVLAIAFASIATTFWLAAGIWLIIVFLSHEKLRYLGIALILIFFSNIYFGNHLDTEDQIMTGLTYCGFLVVGLFGLPKEFRLPVFFASTVAFARLQFAIFLALLLLVGFFFYLIKKNFFDKKEKADALLSVCLMIWLIITLTQFFTPPEPKMLELVKKGVEQANGEDIQNDWFVGHLVEYYGGKASRKAGPPDPEYFPITAGTKITIQELPCEKKFFEPFVDVNLNVFQCIG